MRSSAGRGRSPPRPVAATLPGRRQRRRQVNSPALPRSAPQLVRDLRRYQSELEIQNQALRYSQAVAEGASERFLTLFSNVPLALMVVDEDSLVLESNAMALKRFRPLEHDPPLNFLLPFVSGQHVQRVRIAFDRARSESGVEASEVVFSCGSGGQFTGDLHIARIENRQDELAHFICAIIDQSPLLAERRALRDSAAELQTSNLELQLSKNRLAAVIDSALDAIVCVDADHRITIFNPAAAALFQCPSSQAIGSPLARFIPDAAVGLSYTNLTTHAQLGEITGLTASGGEIAIEVNLSFENSAEGGITTVFVRDLSARKKIEAHRNALESQLRESHKMQAVGTMAGGIAHDFNNIISAILGNAALAQQDVAPGSPAQVSLTEIDKAGRRARDLVRQILAFSRNEAPERVPLDLAEVVQETVRLLRVTLPPLIELTVELQPDTPKVMADATQVEQALLNLCTNAIQAIGPQRGSVRVQLGLHRSVQLAGLQAPASLLEHARLVRLAVSDTGSGMAAETLERVFEPFFTTKPVGQGTGLGLAVVHGVMRTHEGTVQVHSVPGQGSEFSLWFPPCDALGATPPDPWPAGSVAEWPAPSTTGRGERVMYVDDDEALVFLVGRVLKRQGYAVTTCTDPREAAARLRADPMGVDLLVTDYNMPGYSGIDLLREARSIRADLPVALASGYVTQEIEQSALAAGALALIHKPNDVDELCETVHRLLDGADRSR
ncbi:MAG: response regulator [Rhodoferax sp.]|nr:response regulator [Rhodoferax sp.]